MSKRSLMTILPLALAVVLVTAACSKQASTNTAVTNSANVNTAVANTNLSNLDNANANTAATNTTVTTATESVNMQNFAFSPQTISVKKGTKVTWTNNDSVTHIIAGDKNEFASSRIAPGQTFSFTFNAVGSFPYHCDIHPTMMMGTVTVTN
ncbi:MAG: plastocyanin/azurin family copper-binding protein [Patescibacteria group bacterium]|jgi:plastocyanin